MKKPKWSISEGIFFLPFFIFIFSNPQLTIFLIPPDGCRRGSSLILFWQEGKKKKKMGEKKGVTINKTASF